MKHHRAGLAVLSILACVAPAVFAAGGPPKGGHEEWNVRLKAGPKMEIRQAGFFGAGGTETFVSIAKAANGDLIAFGDSWGPPFPETPKVTVIGPERLIDLPIFQKDYDKDASGNPRPPPDDHPNRTGFLVRYASDLSRIEQVVRFGWGVATIDGGVVLPDGGIVIAGTCGTHFDSIEKDAKGRRIPSPKDGFRCFGPTVYGETVSPGNVYAGRFDPARGAFDWLWVLEGYRVPPRRLFATRDNAVVFESNKEIFRVAAGGATCTSLLVIPAPVTGENTFLADVDPAHGTLLVAGSREVFGRRDAHLGQQTTSCAGPAVDLFDPDGKLRTRLYSWPLTIAANPRIDLGSPCTVIASRFLPDGRLAVFGEANASNTPILANPVDIMERCRKAVVNMTPAYPLLRVSKRIATRAKRVQMAIAQPGAWTNSLCATWSAIDGIMGSNITARGILGMRDGRMAVWGESGRWLVQTDTNTFRAYGQVRYRNQDERISQPDMDGSGRAVILAIGGEGPYLTVFNRDFSGLAWSSALPGCMVADAVEVPRGLAVVSRCTPEIIPRYQDTPAGMENRPPAKATPWTKFGGGLSDGHILVLEDPKGGVP